MAFKKAFAPLQGIASTDCTFKYIKIGFLIGFFWFAIPRIGEQITRFKEEIPQVVQEIQGKMETSEV